MATKKTNWSKVEEDEAKINLMYARAAGVIKADDPKYKKVFAEMDAKAAGKNKKTVAKKNTKK